MASFTAFAQGPGSFACDKNSEEMRLGSMVVKLIAVVRLRGLQELLDFTQSNTR